MLTVHHLGVSQSERIVWLCEELGVEYKLIKYTRDPLLSPDSLKSKPGNDLGQAPFFEDDSNGVKLSESAAIAEYVAGRYGNGKLIVKPNDPNYGDYLQWFHYSNGTLQPAMVDYQFIDIIASEDNDIHKLVWDRLQKRFEYLDKHLGTVKYLAGSELSLADIMTVYSLSTQRYWVGPRADFSPYKNIVRYLQDIGRMPSYQKAMEKGDPEMKLLLDEKPPEKAMFEAGGVVSDHWKK